MSVCLYFGLFFFYIYKPLKYVFLSNLNLSVYISILNFSICLFVCLLVYLFFYIYIPLKYVFLSNLILSFYMYVVSMSVFRSICPSISMFLSNYPPIYLFFYLYTPQFVHSVCMSGGGSPRLKKTCFSSKNLSLLSLSLSI